MARGNRPQMAASLSPLSSRPKRSEVEGSAVSGSAVSGPFVEMFFTQTVQPGTAVTLYQENISKRGLLNCRSLHCAALRSG
jgi:hypothetical protein